MVDSSVSSPIPPAPPTSPLAAEPASLRAWRWIAAQEGGGRIHTVTGDPGGTTKWGFAQRYNQDINVADLTFASAYTRFVDRYWVPLRCSALPYPVALALADYAFNAGADDAIPALQRTSRASVDGVIGQRTINAVVSLFYHNPARFMNDFLSYRILKYAESPRLPANRGWLVRTLALRGAVEKELPA